MQRDRTILCKALSDYRDGGMDHLDEAERVLTAESIARRIADLDKKLAALDGA